MEAKHQIGQLEFLGINLHQYFDNPFFKDHNFNTITDNKTHKTLAIDPSVSDYLWISKVALKEG